jgi:hypothetical protein
MDKIKNGELMLVNAKQDVSDEVLSKIPDFKAALKLCKEISGLNDQQICASLGIEPAQWSRIWSGQAHFPPGESNLLNGSLRELGSSPLAGDALRAGIKADKINFGKRKRRAQSGTRKEKPRNGND